MDFQEDEDEENTDAECMDSGCSWIDIEPIRE